MTLVEDFGTALEGSVYQMNLASRSLFGESVGNNTHPFESYIKYLANNGKSLDFVVTTLSFNEDNDNSSVLFTPSRFINKAEHSVTSVVAAKPEVQKLVMMTPYQADASGRAPAIAAPKPQAASPEAGVAEPVKRESKKVEPTPVNKKALGSVIDAWTLED